MKSSCKPCEEIPGNPVKTKTGWLSSLLVVLLPKCPFCIVAYSSAITVCGTPGIADNNRHLLSYLPLLFALLVPVMILFNFRDRRSVYALLISFTGIALIAISISNPYSAIYWSGTIALFFSVWLNSSLLYILKYLALKKDKLSSTID